MRREFYVLYDYGQGGLWAIIEASSAEQILRRLPQLQVFEDVPPMLSNEAIAVIRCGGVQRIDAEHLNGWLGSLEQGE